MTITALPTPPSRDTPSTFADDADAFLGALPAFATEANALATAVNADAVSAAADAVSTAADAVTTGADATSASASAIAAASSAAAAADSFLDIDKKYLGPKAVAPTLDNEGAALTEGALYFDTVANSLFAYTGTAWQVAYAPAGDYVINSSAAVAGNIVVFNGTSGKSIIDTGITPASLSLPPFLLYAQGII